MGGDIPKALDIAHHEAGHAVAGYLLGRRFTSLSVWGRIQFEPVPLEDRDAIATEVIATLAGPLAQQRAVRSPGITLIGWHILGEGGDDSDMAITRRLLTLLCGDDRGEAEREFRHLCASTEELLDQTPGAWQAINTLATVLYDRETLSYTDATQIIQAALLRAGA